MVQADDDFANETDETFIKPPKPNVDTDENTADENKGGMAHNLTVVSSESPTYAPSV